MATIAVGASTNINGLTYANGDLLQFNNVTNSFVRLTIDAQVPADVTKVESFFPANFGTGSASAAEIEVKNTSTTTPLIVKMFGESLSDLRGPGFTFKVRGAWISIGTGTGAADQALSTVIGGKTIDWPPFVQVETAAGSGVYVTMLNIGGAYKDGYSGSGRPGTPLTPTLYTFPRSFADCTTTRDGGHFFEFDEENSSIKFGKTGTGGWRPPNGANIRIPNIHFTGTDRPNATAGSRCRFTLLGARVDWEICSFSNRWSTMSQIWPVYCRMRDVGVVPNCGFSTSAGTIDVDGYYSAVDVYAASCGFGFTGLTGDVSISNVNAACVRNGVTLTAIPNIQVLGEIRSTLFNKNTQFAYPVVMTGCSGNVDSPPNIGPFYVNGNGGRMSACSDFRLNGYYFSDQTNGVASATNTARMLNLFESLTNVVIEKWRLLDGGCPSTSSNVWQCNGAPSRNVAFHDIDINGGGVSWGFDTIVGGRVWLANITLNNILNSGAGAPFGASNGMLRTYPCRVANYLSNTPYFTSMEGGTVFEGVSAASMLIGQSNQGWTDGSPVNLMRTTTNTVGTLYCLPGTISETSGEVEVVTGTATTDYTFNGNNLILPGNGVRIEYTGARPIRGVTGAGSATFTTTGTSMTSVTYQFRLRNHGDTTWPAWQTLNAANFTAAFAALSGYDSDIGFDFSFSIDTTAAVILRTFSTIEVRGLGLDAAWVPAEVGFIQVGVVSGTNGAVAAVAENTTPSAPVLVDFTTLDSSGEYQFEFPYAFNGVAANYKTISRKVGYAESVATGTCFQAGASVPAVTIAQFAATDADIDAANMVINGSTKTFTLTAAHTGAEIYQRAQWWSTQRSNILYDIPLTSLTGTTFTQPTGWTFTGIGNATGGKTWSGGTFVIGAPATIGESFSGTTLSLGPEGAYDLIVSSSTINFAPTVDAATYTLGDGVFSGTITLTNTSGHTCTVELPSGVTVSNSTSGANLITVVTPTVHNYVNATVLANTRVVLYNVTQDVEIDNQFIAGTSYSFEITTEADDGDTLDLFYFKEGYQEGRTRFAWGAATQTVAVEQLTDDAIQSLRTELAITDYTTITEFVLDITGTVEIDADDADGNTMKSRLAIWYNGVLTTEDGARYLRGAISILSTAAIRINVGVLDLRVANISVTYGLNFTDTERRLYRSDGSPIYAAASAPGSIQNDYEGVPDTVETGVSGLTGPESSQLMGTLQTDDARLNNLPLIPALL